MRNTAIVILAAIAAFGAGVLVATPTSTDIRPCKAEWSTNCFWDASTSGNGIGTSFVDVDGTAYYPER